MGYWSEKMINDAAIRQTALDILVEAGTLQMCEYHEGNYFEGSGDLEAAYRLANYQLTQNGGATPSERRELTDAIKAAYPENSINNRCEECHDPRR
jgi:hypothetical protein